MAGIGERVFDALLMLALSFAIILLLDHGVFHQAWGSAAVDAAGIAVIGVVAQAVAQLVSRHRRRSVDAGVPPRARH